MCPSYGTPFNMRIDTEQDTLLDILLDNFPTYLKAKQPSHTLHIYPSSTEHIAPPLTLCPFYYTHHVRTCR